jgi:hypothetical protein
VVRPFALALLTLVGCGQILGLDDPVAKPTTDAAPAHDAPSDVGPAGDGGACDLGKPFGAPVPVDGLDLNTPANEGTPRLSPNELTIYFWSDRGADGPGTPRLYYATRMDKGDPFGTASTLPTLASPQTEASPSATGDGITLFWESDRGDGQTGDIYFATRATAMGTFMNPAPVPNVNTTSDEATPYVHPMGTSLYFSSDRPSGMGGEDLYHSARQGDGAFAAPDALKELNSSADEYAPVITADELNIYWGSNRRDANNHGDFDILYAHRDAPSATFGAPTNAGDLLNSSGMDFPGWISPDGCVLYLESTRAGAGGKGGRDLYVARRPQ